ncbi:MAG: hypothetical protein H7328_03775, partial [Bdellovibrio sp.]|nr:hypothetical protein [Bdellovibrio sp.]
MAICLGFTTYLKKLFFLSMLVLMSVFSVSIAVAAPKLISFQTKIYKPDGTPLEASSVQFKFSLMNPLSTCVIYSETFSNVDLSSSGGSVVLALGDPVKAVRSYPVAGSMKWYDAFNNTTLTYTCQTTGTFSPTLIDNRRLVMQFNDGSGNGWQTLSPMDINSVPFAMFAERAETVPASGILQGGASVGQVLKWTGTSWAASTDDSTPSGSVSNVSSMNSYLSVANGGTTPQLTINVGTGINTLAAGDDARITGAFQTATSLSGDLTGTLPNAVIAAGAVTNAKITSVAFSKLTGVPTTLSGHSIAMTSADVTTALGYTPGNGSGAVTSVSADTTSGNPITVGGTASAKTINLPKSTASVNGYLSSADFTLFNSKLSNFTTMISSDVTTALGYTPGAGGGTVGSVTSAATAGNPIAVSASSTSPSIDISRATASVNGYLASSDFSIFAAKGSGSVTGATAAATSGNPITVSASSTSPSIDISRATASVNGYLASADFSTFNNKLGTNLLSTRIFVGNSSNLAEAFVLSGDATISNTGILSLSNTGIGAGTYTKVTVDTKGRVTASVALISSDITTALGYTPGSGGGTVSSVTSAATSGNPITVSASSTSPSIDISRATASVNGYLASSDFTTFAAKLSNFSTLTSSDVTTALSFTPMRPSNNLSEITNTATARSSLGLGTSAILSVASSGDAAIGEVVKGNDSRLTNSRAPSGVASGDLTGTYPDPILKNIVVAGTGSKITYDAKGRVTASVNLNSADITTALGYTPGSGGGT